jgi:hypothetical protein
MSEFQSQIKFLKAKIYRKKKKGLLATVMEKQLELSLQEKKWVSTTVAENSCFGRVLSKQAQHQLWPSDKMFIPCPMCLKTKITIVNARVAELVVYAEMSHVHCCLSCSNNLGKGWRVRRLQPLAPPRLRLWVARFGARFEVPCPVCSENKISLYTSWHEGHDVAACKGGTKQLSNLIPICGNCNLTMGTKSFDVHLTEMKKPSAMPILLDETTIEFILSHIN